MTYHAFSKRLTTARVEHHCVWCCYPIPAGFRYVRERSVYDGTFQNFAWHDACLAAAYEWFEETGCEEFSSGHTMPWLALFQLELQAAGAE